MTFVADSPPKELKSPARYNMSSYMHPARILPPVLVEPKRVKAPVRERRSKVDAEGSNVKSEEFWMKSNPLNAPARPTRPILSNSTRGREASTDIEERSNERERVGFFIVED
jgi:hypothetical protein